jgi:hypothetical protein
VKIQFSGHDPLCGNMNITAVMVGQDHWQMLLDDTKFDEYLTCDVFEYAAELIAPIA